MAIKFYYGGKKEHFSVEFLLPWKKKPGIKWCGKTRVMSLKLRVESLKARVEVQNTTSNPRVTSSNPRIQVHELRVQIHELRVRIHEFKNLLISENSSK